MPGRQLTRVVARCREYWQARRAMDFYAEPVADPTPFGGDPFVYRVVQEDGMFVVVGVRGG